MNSGVCRSISLVCLVDAPSEEALCCGPASTDTDAACGRQLRIASSRRRTQGAPREKSCAACRGPRTTARHGNRSCITNGNKWSYMNDDVLMRSKLCEFAGPAPLPGTAAAPSLRPANDHISNIIDRHLRLRELADSATD